MFKSKRPGVTIIETLLVIVISGALFVVVLGVFNTRKRTQVDDAARQVMSEIAKVRNQAQQGQGPANIAEESILRGKLNLAGNTVNLPGNEVFGQAIEFVPYGGSGEGKMIVHKLMQNPATKAISDYGRYDIAMPDQLQWNIFDVNLACTEFISCSGTETNLSYLKPGAIANNLYLVFRAGTGDGFMLNGSNYSDFDCYYQAKSNCNYNKQPYLRLAFGIPGSSGANTPPDKMKASINRYFAIFDLTVINSQELKVVN